MNKYLIENFTATEALTARADVLFNAAVRDSNNGQMYAYVPHLVTEGSSGITVIFMHQPISQYR